MRGLHIRVMKDGGRRRMGGWMGLRAATWAVALAAAVGVVGVMPDAAMAQGMRAGVRAGPGGVGQTAISKRELEAWARILELSGEQREAVETLHAAYQTEYRAQTKGLQELIKTTQAEFMESQDPSVFNDIQSKSAKFTDQMTALDKQFMDDVKAVLDAKQAEQFPRVERHHRRVKSLPSGMLSGESANLVTIVEDAGLGASSGEVREVLDQYELELDKALMDREAERKEMEKQSQEMMKDFDPAKMDFSKIRQMMKDLRASGVKVRDVNDRYARRLAAVVPEDKRADFEARARRALFPAVYREPYAVKALDAALGFDDLTAEQRDSLSAIKATYERERGAANEKWAAAIAAEEKDGGGDPFMGFGRMMPGGGDDKPSEAEEAKKARMALDKANLEKIKAVLTDEQKDRLPERGDENPWMMNFGGGDDEDADEKPVKQDRRK